MVFFLHIHNHWWYLLRKKLLVIFIFVVIFLVQFHVILVRNGMFYFKNKSSNLVTLIYYVIVVVYIYSWKKIDKILTRFGDALCTFFTFLDVICLHLVAHLYNGVTSLWSMTCVIALLVPTWSKFSPTLIKIPIPYISHSWLGIGASTVHMILVYTQGCSVAYRFIIFLVGISLSLSFITTL